MEYRGRDSNPFDDDHSLLAPEEELHDNRKGDKSADIEREFLNVGLPFHCPGDGVVAALLGSSGNIVNDMSSFSPFGGKLSATSLGIGGNLTSRIDWVQIFAKYSFEVFRMILRFCTRPSRSIQKDTRAVPMLIKSGFWVT
jgi:hypothetical protein